LGGERLDLVTTRPDADRALVARADGLLRDAESLAGIQLATRPELRVYPTVSIYRNATGEPGWAAASTRGRVVRLEPLEVLRASGATDSTLRHEFLHLLIESRARAGLPLWFREGLVLYLSGEGSAAAQPVPPIKVEELAALDRALANAATAEAQRSAYRRACATVARLVDQYGRTEVLSWIERGVPPDLAERRELR
jgi:hypothetical protein